MTNDEGMTKPECRNTRSGGLQSAEERLRNYFLCELCAVSAGAPTLP